MNDSALGSALVCIGLLIVFFSMMWSYWSWLESTGDRIVTAVIEALTSDHNVVRVDQDVPYDWAKDKESGL